MANAGSFSVNLVAQDGANTSRAFHFVRSAGPNPSILALQTNTVSEKLSGNSANKSVSDSGAIFSDPPPRRMAPLKTRLFLWLLKRGVRSHAGLSQL